MPELYPLVFSPIYKERVWGGQRLSKWFSSLPDGRIGEAWVLSDHPRGETTVINGPLAGETIRSLKSRFGSRLLGERGVSPKTGEFPLLFKLLDSDENLSVQVHPSDEYPGLPPGELGKTEMWVVLDALPGSRVVYGLKDGITQRDLAAYIRNGRTMEALNEVEVRQGDVLFVPAGTVHALGAGLVVAEIQQSSDTTYRVYDYDRPGLDGKPRELHVDHALLVSNYGTPPGPTHYAGAVDNQWVELSRCEYFVVSRGACQGDWHQTFAPTSFQAVMVLGGTGRISWAGGSTELWAGSTVLIPAELEAYSLHGEMDALLVSVP